MVNNKMNKLYNEDCEITFNRLEKNSVDLLLTDTPYGTTNLEWDKDLDLVNFWKNVKKVTKPTSAIIIFSKQPFTSKLLLSNQEMFRYELIWEKTRASNNFLIKKQPMQVHENILVFYEKQPTYNDLEYKIPEIYVDKRKSINNSKYTKGHYRGIMKRKKDNGLRHPFSILPFNSVWCKNMHPTQKPIDLFEWIIRSYTNENDIVFDPYIGSGTTYYACKNSNRYCIGSENNKDYFNMINQVPNQKQEVLFKDQNV